MKKIAKKLKPKPTTIVPEVVEGVTYDWLLDAIGDLFGKARANVALHVNEVQVLSYWQTGRYIVEYEQNGRDRAKYGDQLLPRLTHDLTIRYGRGYGKSNLIYMRKLYRAFPKGMTASYQLTWSHYLEILKSDDPLEIEFYCAECSHSHWNVRELRRQKQSMLFQRLALSKDRKGVLELARRGNEIQTPEDVFRDRYVLEFAGIRPRSRYTEPQLHLALVNHLKMFMLELGKGFAWVASQYPIPLNTKNPHHVDLVFYNYFLHCFVLIDLKRDRVEHYDVGQMNMYLNYFRSEKVRRLTIRPSASFSQPRTMNSLSGLPRRGSPIGSSFRAISAIFRTRSSFAANLPTPSRMKRARQRNPNRRNVADGFSLLGKTEI